MISAKVRIYEDNMGKGLKDVFKRLTGLGRQRLALAAGREFRAITRENFGPIGVSRPIPWAPYKRNYPKWGKRKGQPATLIQTGRLMHGISVTPTATGVLISSDLPYSEAHQFGTSTGLPPRPYFPIISSGAGTARLTPYAEQRIERAVLRELEKLGSGQ